MIRVMCTYFV